MSKKLKQCPCCGEPETNGVMLNAWVSKELKGHEITCFNCGLHISTSNSEGCEDTEAETIRTWNTRAESEETLMVNDELKTLRTEASERIRELEKEQGALWAEIDEMKCCGNCHTDDAQDCKECTRNEEPRLDKVLNDQWKSKQWRDDLDGRNRKFISKDQN